MLSKVSILFLFICLLTFSGCSPRTTFEECEEDLHLASINIIDRNGFSETINSADRLKKYENVDFLKPLPYQKVMRVYERDSEGNISSVLTSYYPNGQPQQYLEVLNGRAFGSYKEWHSNGKLKIDSTVIGGAADLHPGVEKTWLFDGLNRAWDEDGHLLADIYYEKGDLEGTSIYYHTNGSIWKNIPYCKNRVNGTVEIFLDDGQLLQTAVYIDGYKEGPAIRYWDPSKIASQEQYQKDRLISAQYFDNKGLQIAEIVNGNGFRAIFGKDSVAELQEYRQGLLDGQIKVFSANGRLKRTYSLKNGVKHGEELIYDDLSTSPQPKLSISWYQDLIQGPVKTWYPNGTQESQRDMVQNKKNGVSMSWYQDGHLMLIEEYDHDKLVRGEYFTKGDKIPVSRVIQGKGTATLFDSNGQFSHKINYANGKPVVAN